MSREVPFDVDERCDECNQIGAFDFMGDYICADCLKKMEQSSNEYTEKEKS